MAPRPPGDGSVHDWPDRIVADAERRPRRVVAGVVEELADVRGEGAHAEDRDREGLEAAVVGESE